MFHPFAVRKKFDGVISVLNLFLENVARQKHSLDVLGVERGWLGRDFQRSQKGAFDVRIVQGQDLI